MPLTLTARPYFQSAARVEADRLKQESAGMMLLPVPQHSKFSEHLKNCWDDARDAKTTIQSRLLKCAKSRKSEYDSIKLAAIKSFGGSEAYVPATNLKCTAAHDYISDIFNANERPFMLIPTPIPSLPPDLQMEIIVRVQTEVMSAPPGVQFTEADIMALDARATKEVMDALQKEARDRAEKMTVVVDDRLTEGGWKEALAEVIDDIVTYPAGIMKGPVYRMKKRQVWVENPDGSYGIKVEPYLCKEFERVSPFDFYPQRNIRNTEEGYVFERLRLNRRKITEMKGSPGYSDKEIDAVLAEAAAGTIKINWLMDTDTYADEAEERDILQDSPEGRIDGLEFWGSVPGQWLLDWGMSSAKIPDPGKEYQITAVLIGTHIIRAVLNPHPLGLKPYHVVSWRKTPGAFWGQGIPEIVEDIQEVLNAVVRALVNNVAIASGPQLGVDAAMLRPGEIDKIRHPIPWGTIILDSTQNLGMGGSWNGKLPLDYFQPSMQSDLLLRVIQAFTQMMDEYTGIPAYTHGSADTGGAAETSSGLAMLMTAAGKIIKNIARKIDVGIVASTVRRVFEDEMQYNPDNSIKGDAQIVAMGSGAIIAKEQQLVRLLELLNMTRNDVDMQIVGLKGRAELLKDVFHRFDLNLDHIIPDVEELMRREEQMQQLIAMKEQRRTGNLDQPKGRTLDNAGVPAGGTDQALFMPQRQEGVAA